MKLRILIAPDKFKGTLTASSVASAIARGWKSVRPSDNLRCLPLSDGGDGFGEILGRSLGAKPRRVRTVDAAHRPVVAPWFWHAATKTAIIESSTVIGLAQLPAGRFHPFQLDTFGMGAVVLASAKAGTRRCVIGIGGSATNDGGFGLARALGWRFRDAKGLEIGQWTGLSRLAEIVPPRRRRLFPELIVAVDVQNPLLGRHGASKVYGPQKGLRLRDFAIAERCLWRLAQITWRTLGRDFAAEPGAGAAGGLGFGLAAYAGARFQSGFDLVARHSGFMRELRHADLVITGEGALDDSTLMGKGTGRVAEECAKAGVPCIGLAGILCFSPDARSKSTFASIHSLTQMTSMKQARSRPGYWLEKLAARVASGCAQRRFDGICCKTA